MTPRKRSTSRRTTRPVAKRRTSAPPPRRRNVRAMRKEDLEALRTELEAKTGAARVPRWNADPQDVQRSVARLVLALVEFIRKLLERQAIRRMEHDTLSAEEIERVGLALMRLEETVHRLAAQFGLKPEELNLDLGPVGKLM